MKRARFAALLTVSVLLATTLSFQSCNVIRSILGSEEETNRAPTVSLSSSGGSTVYSDQDVVFTATATDPDGDSLTYTWYINSSLQSGNTNTRIFYWLAKTNRYPTVSVTVNDGRGKTATANYSMTIVPGGSVRLYNNSYNSITDIRAVLNTASTWGNNLLSGTFAYGSVFTIYGMAASYYYDFYASNTSYTWDTRSSYPNGINVSNGYYRYLELDSGSNNYVLGNQNDTDSYSILPRGTPEDGFYKNDKPFMTSIRPLSILQNESLQPNRDEDIPFIIE